MNLVGNRKQTSYPSQDSSGGNFDNCIHKEFSGRIPFWTALAINIRLNKIVKIFLKPILPYSSRRASDAELPLLSEPSAEEAGPADHDEPVLRDDQAALGARRLRHGRPRVRRAPHRVRQGGAGGQAHRRGARAAVRRG